MNISGVLIHSRPEYIDQVKSQLSNLTGVEVHAATDDGRLVVTVEDDEGPTFETMNSFHDIEGVLATSLIYHHFDDEPDS